MSLPLPWINRLFEKLTVTYGSAFLQRWRDVDINTVKSDWSHELSGYDKSPSAIAFALANLPERPPTVIEFRSLCRQAPAQVVPQIDGPRADPERVKAELAKLGVFKETIKAASGDRGEWCQRILQRQADGAKISPAVITMAKDGLQNLGLHSRVDNHKSLEENQL